MSTTAIILYLASATGAVGLYLLLPKQGPSHTKAGTLIGLIALIGLMTVIGTRLAGPDTSTGYFYVFATIAILGAVRVVTHPKPVYAAVYFVLVVVAVAALMVLLHAEFLAVALLIIYAGAILVTYLFVIMLAQQTGASAYDLRSREPFWSVVAGFVVLAALAGQMSQQMTSSPTTENAASQSTVDGNSAAIGEMVMTKHVVVLEIAGLLLLISMIGAIALARKDVPSEGFESPPKPLGQVGREVEPF